MDMENTTSFAEESLDDMFELDIRVSSTSDEELSLLLTYVDCAEDPSVIRRCTG
jgi:hypothetical protein